VNCTYICFICNFLDFASNQTPRGLLYAISDKLTQPEYAGIDMIHMPHIQSNICISVKVGIINSQFYSFLRLCNSKVFFTSQMVGLAVLWKDKGYPLKRTVDLLKTFLGISVFRVS
jgi:hypothetical protein